MMKPLFIPLKTEFYNYFLEGRKHSELRLYGKRWNETTCIVGRKVILSKGYGKQNRITGIIGQFIKREARTFGKTYQASIMNIYGTLDKPIAEIRIILDAPTTKTEEK